MTSSPAASVSATQPEGPAPDVVGGSVCAVRRIVVSAEAARTRRALGPLVWTVLEELALGADRDGPGELTVGTSVRRLAAELRVAKDTAARAP